MNSPLAFFGGDAPLKQFVAPDRNSDVISGGYSQIPHQYYHPNPTRNALGLFSGNEVSIVSGNLVDLESDLRNITRDLSNAPSKKYQPSCPGGALGSSSESKGPTDILKKLTEPSSCDPQRIVFVERGTGTVQVVDTRLQHLPTTQYVSYPGVPMPDPVVQEVFGFPWRF